MRSGSYSSIVWHTVTDHTLRACTHAASSWLAASAAGADQRFSPFPAKRPASCVPALCCRPQLGMVFQTKRVFYKHRDANFFPSLSYAVGLLLTQLPQSTLESVLFSVVVYFLVNFSRTGAVAGRSCGRASMLCVRRWMVCVQLLGRRGELVGLT